MGKRRKARESALHILFQMEFNDSPAEDLIVRYWQGRRADKDIKDYSRWLVSQVDSHHEEIDRLIQDVSEHWSLSRMAVVDRNILRVAISEFLYEDNVAPAVIIDEAIEIAKKYSGPDAAQFINGVLDAVRKSLVAKAGEESAEDG